MSLCCSKVGNNSFYVFINNLGDATEQFIVITVIKC